jgi:KTSC domain
MSVVNAVEWVPLESSVFTAVAYRAGTEELYLRFQEGNVYCYFACPRSVYEALLAAESKGRYFAQHIRNGFHCERVHRENHAGSRAVRDSRDGCTAEWLRKSILLAKARPIQKRDAAHAAGVQS